MRASSSSAVGVQIPRCVSSSSRRRWVSAVISEHVGDLLGTETGSVTVMSSDCSVGFHRDLSGQRLTPADAGGMSTPILFVTATGVKRWFHAIS